jgi:hypothetical protein
MKLNPFSVMIMGCLVGCASGGLATSGAAGYQSYQLTEVDAPLTYAERTGSPLWEYRCWHRLPRANQMPPTRAGEPGWELVTESPEQIMPDLAMQWTWHVHSYCFRRSVQ